MKPRTSIPRGAAGRWPRLLLAAALPTLPTFAQDWPQWRGPNRDAHVTGFQPPSAWPGELKQQWKVNVGEGVATPALVGNRLFVFSREEGQEVLRCLDAETGRELWQDRYESLGATGPAQSFSGPRSSPAVAAGKVVTVGVRGVISCLDAATGKVLWRKDDFKAWPNFFVSSSPLIADGLCLAQLGGRDNGALVAYDLATGGEKWRCPGTPAYASPVLVRVDGTAVVMVQTESGLQAVALADGRKLWEAAPPSPPDSGGGEAGGPGRRGPGGRGGGRDYRATTPAVAGDLVVVLGQSAQAWRLGRAGEELQVTSAWTNPDKPCSFASPLILDGLIFGLSGANDLFCLDRTDGRLLWSAPVTPPATETGGAPAGPPGGGRMRGGGGGYGSLVAAGKTLMALTPAGQLIVFEPDRAAFKELARIKVADTPVHAHPVVSSKRLFIKDRDALICWGLP